jgi:hypothetical protein
MSTFLGHPKDFNLCPNIQDELNKAFDKTHDEGVEEHESFRRMIEQLPGEGFITYKGKKIKIHDSTGRAVMTFCEWLKLIKK